MYDTCGVFGLMVVVIFGFKGGILDQKYFCVSAGQRIISATKEKIRGERIHCITKTKYTCICLQGGRDHIENPGQGTNIN